MLILLALAACKVVDAPANLEALATYTFANYDDPEALVAAVDSFPRLVDKHVEALESGYRVDDLTAEDLESAGILDAEVEGVIGAMGTVTYASDLVDVLDVVTAKNKAERYDNVLAYDVQQSSDRGCFLKANCEQYDETVSETTKVTLLGEASRTFDATYRWVEGTDGDTLVVARTLSPNPVSFSTDVAEVHQQYALVLLYDDGKRTRRVETFWVDAALVGVDVPDSFAVDNAVNAMAAQAERVDEQVSGG